MGRSQQMSISVEEPDEGKVHVSDFRSTVRQRRLICVVAFFVALFPFAVTRSYLFYTNGPEVLSEISTSFFEGQPAPGALRGGPLREDDPQFINSNGTRTDTNEKGPESRNEVPEPVSFDNLAHPNSSTTEEEGPVSFDDLARRNSSTTGEEEEESVSFDNLVRRNSSPTGGGEEEEVEATATDSEIEKSHLDESNYRPLNASVNSTRFRTTTSAVSKGECNIEQGKWIPDARPPMYNSSTCKYIQDFQNCEMNGRPDVGYLYWKWKPDHCELPRIDARAFLTAMRNRSVVFAGDSIARNQFQSLLCVLSQVEDPKHTVHTLDDQNNAYLFQSFNVTLGIYWSSHLVRVEEKSITWPDNTTDTVKHIYLDELDKNWVKAAVGADILHLSTGQWWFKKAMYLEKGKPIGCHAWPACFKQLVFDKAYATAIANILKGSLKIPGFNGTTVYRSFAPEHFEGGDWDSGGVCPRTAPGGVPMSFLANWMYGIQMKQFKNVSEELGMAAKDRLKLLGVTNLAQVRADGHPNMYRSNVDKISDKRANGIPNDCLHWCLPGPIDTWNDLLVESLH